MVTFLIPALQRILRPLVRALWIVGFSLNFGFVPLFSLHAQESTVTESCVTTDSSSPIAAALQPFVDRGEMPGFVTLVADRDGVVQCDAVGWADIDAQRPMSPETLFWIASMSKSFSATATMILVDEGKMSPDDPITKYLPEMESLKIAIPQENGDILLTSPDSIPTIRQILSHTSGWPFKAPYILRFGNDSLPLDQKAYKLSLTPLEFQPGTKYQYSNMGIDVAAAIVEKVSGMKYDDFLKKRIFEPLNMTHTTYHPTVEQVATLATSYRWSKERNTLEPTTIYALNYPLEQPERRFAEGGGGLFSTVGDLAKFYQMFLNRGVCGEARILSEAAVDEMSRKQTGDAVKDSYGFGLSVGNDSFGHGGAYATEGIVYKTAGYVTVYLVQVTGVPKQSEAKKTFDQAVRELRTEN